MTAYQQYVKNMKEELKNVNVESIKKKVISVVNESQTINVQALNGLLDVLEERMNRGEFAEFCKNLL